MKNTKYHIALLTFTSLLMRGVSVLFSGYLNHKIGPVGVGTYSLLMSVYSLFITLAVSGIRLAASRLCTQQTAMGRSPIPAAKGCMIYSAGFGSAAAAALYLLASPVAQMAVSQKECAPCLKVLALCLPFIATANSLCGYFVSQNMLPLLSVVSVAEQLCKIGLSVILLNLLPAPTGLQSCMALVIANAMGEAFSFMILLSVFWYKKTTCLLPESSVSLTYVFKTALPLGVSYYLRNGLSTLEHLLIPKGLQAAGGSVEETIGTYGTIHGLVFPALMLPIAPIDSAGEILLSILTYLQTQNNKQQIKQITQHYLQLSFGYSILVCAMFGVFHQQIAILIYRNVQLGFLFLLLCPLVVFYYSDAIIDSMLKGLGCQLASMRYSMIDSVLGVGLFFLLLPKYGIAGYIVSLYATKLINLALSLNKLIDISQSAFRYKITKTNKAKG